MIVGLETGTNQHRNKRTSRGKLKVPVATYNIPTLIFISNQSQCEYFLRRRKRDQLS